MSGQSPYHPSTMAIPVWIRHSATKPWEGILSGALSGEDYKKQNKKPMDRSHTPCTRSGGAQGDRHFIATRCLQVVSKSKQRGRQRKQIAIKIPYSIRDKLNCEQQVEPPNWNMLRPTLLLSVKIPRQIDSCTAVTGYAINWVYGGVRWASKECACGYGYITTNEGLSS